jgi:hypothetical protein
VSEGVRLQEGKDDLGEIQYLVPGSLGRAACRTRMMTERGASESHEAIVYCTIIMHEHFLLFVAYCAC